jgi:hypothetical protein
MPQPVKIFISSPVNGLEEARKSAIEAVIRTGHYPSAQEYWSASLNPSLQECLARVAQCRALILLLGPTYGTIDPESQKSITQLEYEEAERLDLPRFVFPIIPPNQDKWQPQDVEPAYKEKHQRFYEKIRDTKTGVFYKKAHLEKLEQEIAYALQQYQDECGPLGPRIKFFQKFDEYFKDFLSPGALFTLDQPFVGQIHDNLNNFISCDSKIGVIYGRGGIGKTKLLYEFAKTFKDKFVDWEIRFIWPQAEIENASLYEISTGKYVIVLDDADHFSNIERILSLLRDKNYADRVKFILVARQSNKKFLKSILSQINEKSEELVTLDRLNPQSLTELARFSLKDKATDAGLVQQLATISKDCPLVTVIGGRLIAEGKIAHDDPVILGNQTDFQRAIFDRLLSEYTTKLPGYFGSPEKWDTLIRVLSAIGPVYPANEALREKLSEILNLEPYQVVWDVMTLEEHGLLYRAGRRVRLVPDILADHILEEACVDHGTPTPFPEKVFKLFKEEEAYLSNLLENLGQLEYRITQGNQQVLLLDGIWKNLINWFRETSHAERAEFLKYLRRFALFQPQKVLDLCIWAIENPAKKSYSDQIPDEWKAWLREPTHEVAIKEIPGLLRSVSYHFGYLETVCELLWKLGRDDARETNPYPEHPIRVLVDIGEYGINKPPDYNEKYLKIISSWLDDPTKVYGYKYSIVNLFKPLLARAAEEASTEGFQLVLSWRPLPYSVIESIRKKALFSLLRVLDQGRARDKSQVIEILGTLLANPESRYGTILTEGQLKEWIPEQLDVLKIFENILNSNPSPFLKLAILDKLDWPSQNAWHPGVRNEALHLLKSIQQQDLDFKIISSLSSGNFSKYLGENFEEARKRRREEADLTAAELLEKFQEVEKIEEKLNAAVVAIRDSGWQLGEGILIAAICKKNIDLAKFLAQRIYEQTESPLAGYLHVILDITRRNDPGWSESFIQKCISSAAPSLKWLIAYGYGYGGWLDISSKISDSDWENIKRLTQDQDHGVKMAILHALSRRIHSAGSNQPKEEVDLAMTIQLDSDPKLANELANIFSPPCGYPVSELTEDEIVKILDNFVPIENIDHEYALMHLLLQIYTQDPRKIIDFFLKRIDFHMKDKIRSLQYHPVPFSALNISFVSAKANASYWSWYLKKFFERIETCNQDIGCEYWVSKLFEFFADYKGLESPMLVLIQSAKSKKSINATIALLQSTGSGFILDKPEIVAEVLSQCWSIGKDTYDKAFQTFLASAMSGASSGTPGQPHPALVAKLESAKVLAEKFKKQLPAKEFYDALASSVKSEIDRMLEHAEELLDDQG